MSQRPEAGLTRQRLSMIGEVEAVDGIAANGVHLCVICEGERHTGRGGRS